MSTASSRLQIQLVVIAVFAVSHSYGATMSDKKALYTNLTKDYNKDIPPVKYQNEAVLVNISLSLVSLNDIDEVLEMFSVSGFFTIMWYDESMVWNGWDYGNIYQLLISYNNVWVPEIILLNPTEKAKSLGLDWNKIRYYSTGLAQWFPGDLIRATCTIDVYNFPFDTQVCDLQMQAYGYGTTELQLISSRTDVDTSAMAPHSSWIISETKAYVTEALFSSQAVFRFHFERRPQFVIVNVILPILLMCFLNVMVFLLPVDSGERIGFAITVLLAIAVYMTIVSDNLPKTSEPLPLISYFLIICLIVSVLITVVTVLNLRLFHKDSDEPVPRWLIRVYNTLTCKTHTQSNKDGKMEISKIPYSMPGADNGILPSNKVVTPGFEKGPLPSNKVGALPQDSKDEALVEKTPVTWKDISTFVDYVSLLVSTSTLLLSFMVIMLVARNSNQ